ncbi:MAG: hypothetical protein P4M01_14845 [Acidobacteriota bacterium]|nr:hypothetical protein [Acidobacteriota bacterium]
MQQAKSNNDFFSAGACEKMQAAVQLKFQKAVSMSAINGDKSRFHRLRKQRLLKREIKAAIVSKDASATKPAK